VSLPGRLRAAAADGHLAWRIRARLRRSAGAALARAADRRRCTFGPWAGDALASGSALPEPEVLAAYGEELRGLARMYAEHRFDALGSGWVQVRHGMRCRGIEGVVYLPAPPVEADPGGAWLRDRVTPANLAAARAAWGLVDAGYVPIDWHLDVRSGHRWSELEWHGDVAVGRPPGADVKVPWELARMQHLPQLALVHALDGDGPAREALAREFRNQVLDFVATNPPRFGVNWASPMDVGIRAANWALACRLFTAGGARFDAPFRRELVRSLLAHGRHVAAHLEWAPVHRGNHYLSNVVSLLLLGAWLPRSAETDAWLAFGVRELEAEAAYQFGGDGSGFEGSTAYHRLSAEMVAFATAVALGLDSERRAVLDAHVPRRFRGRPRTAPRGGWHDVLGLAAPSPFSRAYFERLSRMGTFTAALATPDGTVPQVGDNDSGRFFKLAPPVHRLSVADAVRRYASLDAFAELPPDADYWDEDPLRHDALPAVTDALVSPPGSSPGADSAHAAVERAVARSLAGGACVRLDGAADPSAEVRVGSDGDWEAAGEALLRAGDGARTIDFPVPGGGARDGLELRAWPDFGLYLVRSRRVYLLVRCGPIGSRGLGVHDHADQLAVELRVDGEPRVRDPGTGVYTSFPGLRNRYRSVAAHFAPRVDTMEPAGLDSGLFRLAGAAAGTCAYFGPAGFVGSHDGFGTRVTRRVRLLDDRVVVEDFLPPGAAATLAPPGPAAGLAVSPGYGRFLREDGRGGPALPDGD
jgi:hypothetical protein